MGNRVFLSLSESQEASISDKIIYEGNNSLPLLWLTLFKPSDIRHFITPDEDSALNLISVFSIALQNAQDNIQKLRSIFEKVKLFPTDKFDELTHMWIKHLTQQTATYFRADLTEFSWFFNSAELVTRWLEEILTFDKIAIYNYYGIPCSNSWFINALLPNHRDKKLSSKIQDQIRQDEFKWLLTGYSDAPLPWEKLSF